MPDQSHLDKRYFVDSEVYNCPFCNRRNVQYWVEDCFEFDWNDKKKCRGFIVECSSCENQSMHLSSAPEDVLFCIYNNRRYDIGIQPGVNAILDDVMFYSVPTSFFVLDTRVPRIQRELLTEAEGCLKGNYLTGASACARKLIYELAKKEQAIGDSYEERIKSLKSKFEKVDPTYFDTLLSIWTFAKSPIPG